MKIFFKRSKKLLSFTKIRFLNNSYSSNKRFIDCLRNIYGVNYFMAIHVCKMCGFSLNYKMHYVSKNVLNFVSDFFLSYFLVERGLKKYRDGILLDKKQNGSLIGYRLFKGLPVNGQRTHTNSKTVRRLFKMYTFNK